MLTAELPPSTTNHILHQCSPTSKKNLATAAPPVTPCTSSNSYRRTVLSANTTTTNITTAAQKRMQPVPSPTSNHMVAGGQLFAATNSARLQPTTPPVK